MASIMVNVTCCSPAVEGEWARQAAGLNESAGISSEDSDSMNNGLALASQKLLLSTPVGLNSIWCP